MSDILINSENLTLKILNGGEQSFVAFVPEKIEISEDQISAFFNDIDEKNIELIVWPINVKDVLTDEDEVYNEEYLAILRKVFIESDKHTAKVLFKPVYDGISIDEVTASMKHTARRLKKMVSIAGFILPENEDFKNEKVRQFFVDELSQKHEQYKFYSC